MTQRVFHAAVLAMGLLCVFHASAQEPKLVPKKLTVEQVKAFMAQLPTFVEKYHLKRDSNSSQRGMTYEYVDVTKLGRLGQWSEGEGFNTMHDGARYGAALVMAYQATADAHYKDYIVTWQIPFYTNMLNNSDKLFADGLDLKKHAPAVFPKVAEEQVYRGRKGFAPYWWDDGAALSYEMSMTPKKQHRYGCVDYYILEGKPNPDGRMNGFSLGCSNHMSQDLAMMLMRFWLLTRDPNVAKAAMNVQDNRASRGPGYAFLSDIVTTAALTNGDANLMAKTVTMFTKYPVANWPIVNLRDGREMYAYSYIDDEAYYWHAMLAKFGGRVSPAMASALLLRVWGYLAIQGYWYDVTGPIPGMANMDLGPRMMKDGKFVKYQSDARMSMPDGSEGGPQALGYSAICLQLLRALPGCWERIAEAKDPQALRVCFVDEPIQLDGRADKAYGDAIELGAGKLQFVSDMQNLYLCGSARGDQVALTIFGDKEGGGKAVKLIAKKKGEASATLADGRAVQCQAKMAMNENGWTYEVKIPYTVDKSQTPWANAIESCYFSVNAGGAKKNLFFLSSEQRIQRRLLQTVEGGIAVWHRIYTELGYIPTGLIYDENISDAWPSGRFYSKKSDLSGYANVIAACAQYILYMEGKTDWDTANVPQVGTAKAPW